MLSFGRNFSGFAIVALAFLISPDYVNAQQWNSPGVQNYYIPANEIWPQNSDFFYNTGDRAGCQANSSYDNTNGVGPVTIWCLVSVRDGYTNALLSTGLGGTKTIPQGQQGFANDLDAITINSTLIAHGVRFDIEWGLGNTPGVNKVGSGTTSYMSIGY